MKSALRRLRWQWVSAASSFVACGAEPPREVAPAATPSPAASEGRPMAAASVADASAEAIPTPPPVEPVPFAEAGAPTPDAAAPKPPPPTSSTAPPSLAAWTTWRDDKSRQPWCRSVIYQCSDLPAGITSCAPERQENCDEEPWQRGLPGGVGEGLPTMCTAKLHLPVTTSERKKHPKACCYVKPQRCPHPGEGRAYRAEPGGAAWAPALVVDPVGGTASAHAESYLAMARFERASVPAFLSLASELEALGAEAPLLALLAGAAREEERHASLALELAVHFGAPSAAFEDDAPPPRKSRNLVDLVRESLHDGCVSELTGALELRDRALATEDPLEARHLLAIAEDEERHALLSLRVIAWILATHQDDRDLRAFVACELALLAASPNRVARCVVCPALRTLALPLGSFDDGARAPRQAHRRDWQAVRSRGRRPGSTDRRPDEEPWSRDRDQARDDQVP